MRAQDPTDPRAFFDQSSSEMVRPYQTSLFQRPVVSLPSPPLENTLHAPHDAHGAPDAQALGPHLAAATTPRRDGHRHPGDRFTAGPVVLQRERLRWAAAVFGRSRLHMVWGEDRSGVFSSGMNRSSEQQKVM